MSKIIVAASLVSLLVLSSLTALSCGCGSGKPVPEKTEYYQVGERAETSQLMVTVNSVTREERRVRSHPIWTADWEYAPPGTVFLRVEVTTTNVGTSGIGVDPSDWTVEDSAGHEWARTIYEGHYPYKARNLAPGETVFCVMLYTVPVDVTGLEVSCIMPGTPPIRAVWMTQ
jgi:hypothetical protein